jgi:nucleotide-binding universal stress UspA family protein
MTRIFVGLDGSPSERHVLAAAVTLATKLGGRLILFHAVNLPLALPVTALAVTPDEVGVLLTRQSEQHLKQLAAKLPAALVERVQVELGVPWRTLCAFAESDGAELIVIGSHGYSGIDRLIGTTAAKVVNHAHCSVLVERTPAS